MSDKQAADFERTKECNFAISPQGIGRFPRQRLHSARAVGMVLRDSATLPTIDGLGMPQVLKEIHDQARPVHHRGCHGSGQIDHAGGHGGLAQRKLVRPHHHRGRPGRIRLHPHKNCVVTQREVGLDTDSWEAALKNTLRQAPDVILMGEIRDRETMEHAVAFAETGHLCLATLHANSANQALTASSTSSRRAPRPAADGPVAQPARHGVAAPGWQSRTARGPTGGGGDHAQHAPDFRPHLQGRSGGIKEIMKNRRNLGMQTFDQALFDLFEANVITYEDALRNADSLNDLRLQIKLSSQRARTTILPGTEHFSSSDYPGRSPVLKMP